MKTLKSAHDAETINEEFLLKPKSPESTLSYL